MTPVDWTDQSAFFAADVRRRRSDEVELGATWRGGSSETWTLSWLRETGELYLVRNDSLVGAGSRLAVLVLLADEAALDARLDGWAEARLLEDGLGWLHDRLEVEIAA